MNCPNCREALSERGCFCKFCGGQARCLQCRELLEPAAAACVECGAPVGKPAETNPKAANGSAPSIASNRNTLSYQEDRNSRRFEASLTDPAIQGLGDVFGELFAHRGAGRVQQQGGTRLFSHEQVVLDIQKHLPPAPDANSMGQQTNADSDTPTPSAGQTTPDLARISQIFRANGETLELIEHRLKAKSGMDYVRRLTYLFLYAHELHGRNWTPRDAVIAVLKEGKIWDSNASHWLNKKQGFRADAEGERLQLIQSGRDDAKKALGEACDPNVTDDWNPDKKVPVKRSPRKKKQ
jgi:hypothetical protein